jgi:hypothetical protein
MVRGSVNPSSPSVCQVPSQLGIIAKRDLTISRTALAAGLTVKPRASALRLMVSRECLELRPGLRTVTRRAFADLLGLLFLHRGGLTR